MCTVSIVPDGDRFRLMSNRDERRDRAVALQPTVEMLGARAAIMPIDPVGGGSWLGVNDAGVVAALLNRHAAPRFGTTVAQPFRAAGAAVGRPARLRAARFGRVHHSSAEDPAERRWKGLRYGRPRVIARRSRGLIVRDALACDSIDAASNAVLALDAAAFSPFRLVLVQNRRIVLVDGDGRELAGVEAVLDHPYMFTASSLGDVFVDSPRRRLFECLMSDPSTRHQGQRLFHRHQWIDKREISVLMEREDAATVSRTVVDVTAHAVALEYESLVPARPSQRVELQPC